MYKRQEDGSYNYPAGSNSNGLQRLEEGGYRQNVNDELLGTIPVSYTHLRRRLDYAE